MPFPSAWRPEVTWSDLTGKLTKFAHDWLFEVHKNIHKAPNFAVANLPTNREPGAYAFATDGRKPTEGAGLGTGVLVVFDGTAWRRTADDTTVAA